MLYQEINVNDLVVSDLNVRKSKLFGLDELAANIKSVFEKIGNDGLINPLTVRKEGAKYKVITGQRRLKAIELLNKDDSDVQIEKVKCMVVKGSKDRDVLLSLSENVFSQQMDQLERFNAYKLLISKGYTPQKIAAAFGTSVTKVNQALAIANLHDSVILAYQQNVISSNIMQHLTNFTHEDQIKVINAAEEYRFHHSSDVDEFLEKSLINVDYAIFDLKDSGIVVHHDLFEDEKFTTDIELFMQKQKEVIDQRIKEHEEKGILSFFHSTQVAPDIQYYRSFYERLEDIQAEYKKYKKSNDFDANDPKQIVYHITMQPDGQVEEYFYLIDKADLIEFGFIEDETKSDDELNSDVDTNSDVSISDAVVESAQKPARQELTKVAQGYFENWQHSMAIYALSQNQSYCLRYMLAKMIKGSNISFDQSSKRNGQDDKQFKSSKHVKHLNKLFKKYAFFKYDPANIYSVDFDDVLKLTMKLSDDELLDAFSIICVMSISVGSKDVQRIAGALDVKPGDYWKADEAFAENVTSSTALDGIASEVIDNNDELTSFVTKKVKEKKACLLEKLPDGFVPKYLNFPPECYGDAKLDMQRIYY